MVAIPSKRQAIRIAHAAQLRAAGNSWQAIGRILGCRPQTCQRWTTQYPEWWNQVYRRIQLEKWRALCATAEQAVREILRSPDAKRRRWAANLILQAAHRDPTMLSAEAVSEAQLVHARDAAVRVTRVTGEGPANQSGGG